MSANPYLKKLGLADTDRAMIIHTDDIGVSAASVAAARDLWQTRIVSSSAVMVPCAWFPLAAQLCRETPHIDMGVHITLTCEWSGMRWGPVSTRDPRTGLMDMEGFFFRTSEDAQTHADTDAAALEIDAQIQRALSAGIDVTHIDTHMGTAFHAKLLSGYVTAALKHRVPPLLLRLNEAQLRARGNDDETAAFFARALDMLEGQGVPMLDHLVGMPLDKPDERFERVRAELDALPAGISYFIIHPSHGTPEAQAMGPDWRARVRDHEMFMDEQVRAHIKQSGLHVIGWRELRDVMRAQ